MNIHDFIYKKQQQQKISMLTCYDYPSACIIAQSGVDCVLVGDSVAMAVHGHPNTLMATMEMMVLHTEAVARGLKGQFLVTDLPFLCHKGSLADTVAQVKKLLQAGAQGVKIEGGDGHTCETIAYLTSSGVPIMGHIGLTPQSLHQLGGFTVQGKSQAQAQLLAKQAQELQKAGCFALVLECIPRQLAKEISAALSIPTIGIGAGAHTDGQILVWHDLLGLQTEFTPKFLKRFAQAKDLMLQAINDYDQEVKRSVFPTPEHSY